MIALDTSALVAIALREPDMADFKDVIEAADALLIGTPTLLELRLVLSGKFGTREIEPMLDLAVPPGTRVVPFDAAHLTVAAEAFRTFGGRPARLNFGDCMAYAVAKVAGCPLLYKGGDFARIDIRSALAA